MALPALYRPKVTSVAFDPKWNPSVEGWPTEALRVGSIEAIVAFCCYYTSRKKRPSLVPPGTKAPIDVEFTDVFWRTFSCVATVEEFASAFVSLASKSNSDRSLLYQVVDALKMGLDTRADYLGYLRSDQQATLLASARVVYYSLAQLPDLLDEEIAVLQELQALLTETARFVDGSAAEGLPRGETRRTAATVMRAMLGSGRDDTPLSIAAASSPVTLGGPSPPLLLGSGVPPRALAEAWALLDESLYGAITPREWLSCGWDRPRFEHAADAVRAFVDKYNACSLWVSTAVLFEPGPAERAAVIVRFIQVAHNLRRLNDFSGVSSIVMGLRREGVSRLGSTWGLVPSSAASRYTSLCKEVEDKEQYRKYKEALRAVPEGHPAVPHLGAHTMEMTAAEMNLPPRLELYRGGPESVSFRRPRELWRMAAPLMALQDPARSYISTGAIQAVDPALAAALSRTLVCFYMLNEEERDSALEKLSARSMRIEPDGLGGMNPTAARAVLETLLVQARKDKGVLDAARAASGASANSQVQNHIYTAGSSASAAGASAASYAQQQAQRQEPAPVPPQAQEDEEYYDEEDEEYYDDVDEDDQDTATAPNPSRQAYSYAGGSRR